MPHCRGTGKLLVNEAASEAAAREAGFLSFRLLPALGIFMHVDLGPTVEGTNVIIPVTEENIADYDVYDYAGLEGGLLSQDMLRGVDDLEPGFRAWRVSELIGDYARIRDADTYANYGYVNDLIMRDGEVVDMDGRRIDKLLASRIPGEE